MRIQLFLTQQYPTYLLKELHYTNHLLLGNSVFMMLLDDYTQEEGNWFDI